MQPGEHAGGAVNATARGRFGAVLDAVGKELGMSRADLAQQFKDGKSLADIAQSKGVSRDQLVQTIASALPSSSTQDPQAIAGRIADFKRGAEGTSGTHRHHHHHHADGTSGAQPSTAATSTTSTISTSGQGADRYL